ncbi:hypothetical protein ZIOFF_008965 [Zingiber officinale]|uniref:RING-type E3 ubiquitin transferase n=1 Tax=Zingiber officinale TaxID=94328 RepID=A0A8J5LR52_ZINOF|nr:hypothetical protein ZIOFF_008965 [Zingiber officinale]
MGKMSLNSAILLYTACKVVPLIVTAEQHFLKYDEVGSCAWVQDYALMLMLSKEAAKDDAGKIRIQRPDKGPFYISPKNIMLITTFGKWARWYQITSPGFTVVGIFLLAKHAVQHVLEKRRCWELQKSQRNNLIVPKYAIWLALMILFDQQLAVSIYIYIYIGRVLAVARQAHNSGGSNQESKKSHIIQRKIWH